MWQNIKMFYRWPEKVEHIFQFYNSIFIYALFFGVAPRNGKRDREKHMNNEQITTRFLVFHPFFFSVRTKFRLRDCHPTARERKKQKNTHSPRIVE